ncbi:MAG: hypothetical protein ACLR8P_09220 [Clostridium fessum]
MRLKSMTILMLTTRSISRQARSCTDHHGYRYDPTSNMWCRNGFMINLKLSKMLRQIDIIVSANDLAKDEEFHHCDQASSKPDI